MDKHVSQIKKEIEEFVKERDAGRVGKKREKIPKYIYLRNNNGFVTNRIPNPEYKKNE
jgi:hypothetical protein